MVTMHTNHQIVDRARLVSPAVATMAANWRGVSVASTTGTTAVVCPTQTTGTTATGAFVKIDRHPRHLRPRPT